MNKKKLKGKKFRGCSSTKEGMGAAGGVNLRGVLGKQSNWRQGSSGKKKMSA